METGSNNNRVTLLPSVQLFESHRGISTLKEPPQDLVKVIDMSLIEVFAQRVLLLVALLERFFARVLHPFRAAVEQNGRK